MPAGRPPRPIEQQVALARGDGRTPGGREIAVVTHPAHAGAPVTPADLGERGVTEWHKVWDAGFWLHPDKDYHWVEQLARAYDDIETFRARIQIDGLVVRGSHGQPAAHPLLAETRAAEKVVQKCLTELGFSPTARARLGVAELKAKNELAKFLDG